MLRKLRRRSLARLRKEVEPVEPEVLGRFLPQWQHVTAGRRGSLRGVDGVLSAVEQLAGCPVPASALEPLVLAARVSDYEPAMLDELTASGEVAWAGHGTLPGSDGWVSLHLADQAPLTLPEPGEIDLSPLHISVLEALAPGRCLVLPAARDRDRVHRRPGPRRPRCGSWCGRAGSATTPWRRCGR